MFRYSNEKRCFGKNSANSYSLFVLRGGSWVDSGRDAAGTAARGLSG